MLRDMRDYATALAFNIDIPGDRGDNPLLKPTGNRDKTLSRSNQPRTSETNRCEEDIFVYELQFLLSRVLSVFQNLNDKLQRKNVLCAAHPTKSSKGIRVQNVF